MSAAKSGPKLYFRRTHDAGVEHGYRHEDKARKHRRRLIDEGRPVSLLSYDGIRDLYVFDELKAVSA